MPQVTVSIEASADDALAFEHGIVTWPGTGSGAQYDTASASTYATKAFIAASNYNLRNPLFRFNTGVYVPDTATITSAVLRVVPDVVVAVDTPTRSLLWEYYAGAFSTAALSATESGTAYAGEVISNYAAGVSRDVTLLNPDANISKTSTTALRGHISGGAPTAGDNTIVFRTYDYDVANATNVKPRLIINYTLPTTRIVPDAIISQTNLTGALSAIQDDPDSADANWLVAP